MIKKYGALLGVALLAACSTPSGTESMRESDLRQPVHEYLDSHIYMDLPTVQRRLYIHRENCEVNVDFQLDPQQVHFATLVYGPADRTDLKDRVMLDLTAYATGKLAMKGYSYYAANKNMLLQLPQILGKPTTCPDGIQAKTK